MLTCSCMEICPPTAGALKTFIKSFDMEKLSTTVTAVLEQLCLFYHVPSHTEEYGHVLLYNS